MTRDELDRMVRLYKWNYIAFHEPRYLKFKANKSRKGYLAHFKKQLIVFLLTVQEDPYLHEITQLNNDGFYKLEPFEKTLTRIEKCRVEFRDQQWFGIEYRQPYVEVNDMVEKEGETEIVRFLAQCFAAEFFLRAITELEKAIDRDGIGQQEELALIRRLKEGKPLRSEPKGIKESFRWAGRGYKQKADALFNRLYKRGFLNKETTSEQFVAIFSGQPVEKPVRWEGQASQLVFVLECLALSKQLEMPIDAYDLTQDGGIKIADEQAYGSWLYSRIEGCFLDSDGNPFSGKRLKHVKSALRNKSKTGKPQRGDELEIIVKEVAADN